MLPVGFWELDWSSFAINDLASPMRAGLAARKMMVLLRGSASSVVLKEASA